MAWEAQIVHQPDDKPQLDDQSLDQALCGVLDVTVTVTGHSTLKALSIIFELNCGQFGLL